MTDRDHLGSSGSVASVRGARVAAAVAAIGWGYFFFGLIDLLVIFIDDGFYDVYLLETGWGLLFLVLVAVPLAALTVRPRSPLLVVQLLAVAAGVAVAAVVTPEWPQLFPAVGLFGTAMIVGLLARQGLLPVGSVRMQSVDRVLLVLVVIALVPALRYAIQMIQAARAGVPDDITWGLPHFPMQAAFAFALVLTGLLAAAGEGNSQPGSRVLAWSVALSAMWFGAVSVAYPEHVASLGFGMGVAWVAWGAVFAIVAEARRRRRHRHPDGADSGRARDERTGSIPH